MKKKTVLTMAIAAAVLASATAASATPPRKTTPLYLKYVCYAIPSLCYY